MSEWWFLRFLKDTTIKAILNNATLFWNKAGKAGQDKKTALELNQAPTRQCYLVNGEPALLAEVIVPTTL